jgi:hypothetical protein
MPYRHPREIERFDSILMEGEKETITPDRGSRLSFKEPGYSECERCEADFWPTGEEERPEPILLCPGCRKKEEISVAVVFGGSPSELSGLSDEALGRRGCRWEARWAWRLASSN